MKEETAQRHEFAAASKLKIRVLPSIWWRQVKPPVARCSHKVDPNIELVHERYVRTHYMRCASLRQRRTPCGAQRISSGARSRLAGVAAHWKGGLSLGFIDDISIHRGRLNGSFMALSPPAAHGRLCEFDVMPISRRWKILLDGSGCFRAPSPKGRSHKRALRVMEPSFVYCGGMGNAIHFPLHIRRRG